MNACDITLRSSFKSKFEKTHNYYNDNDKFMSQLKFLTIQSNVDIFIGVIHRVMPSTALVSVQIKDGWPQQTRATTVSSLCGTLSLGN